MAQSLTPKLGALQCQLHPPEKLEVLQQKIVYPLKIVGKDLDVHNNNKGTLVDRINPYLYLTFEDKTGQIIGPIRYHSELNGRGLKLELSLRAQFGRLSGFEAIEFHSLPTKFTLEKGLDGIFGLGGIFAFSHTRVRFKDQLSPVLLQYFAFSTLGGYGGISLKSGTFEAEEETTNSGLHPSLQKFSLIALAAFFVVGVVVSVLPFVSLFQTAKEGKLPESGKNKP